MFVSLQNAYVGMLMCNVMQLGDGALESWLDYEDIEGPHEWD